MVIEQSDIYWIDLGEPSGSEPGYIRPYIVIQNNAQIFTVDKALLTDKIGNLSRERVKQILAGLTLITEPLPSDIGGD